MTIREICEDKRAYWPLLLLADEQEELIERYLDRGQMFLLEEQGRAIAECVVTDEGEGELEVQNLAVSPEYQGQGYGKRLLDWLAERYRGQYRLLRVGTGDSPLTVPFYERCGFRRHAVLKNYILEHYDHPIYEGGKRLIDKVVLVKEL